MYSKTVEVVVHVSCKEFKNKLPVLDSSKSHYTFIRKTFSWTNMTVSTDDGARELCLAFIVNPAGEKILSRRVLKEIR